jgi:hypothetical protein
MLVSYLSHLFVTISSITSVPLPGLHLGHKISSARQEGNNHGSQSQTPGQG